MIDPSEVAVLQEQIRRTGRSLLQYTTESFPWTHNAKERDILRQIHLMAKAEEAQSRLIARFLIKHRQSPPYLGAYPMHFTTMNFLAIPRLLDLIIDHQQKDIEDIVMAAPQVRDAEAKELLDRLVEIKTAHLNTLKELKNEPAKSSA